MMIILKSEDQKVKNFGLVNFDESGLKNISFLPIEKFDNFMKENKNAEIKNMKNGQSQIAVYLGNNFAEPLVFEIREKNESKFIMKKFRGEN